jgi:hypothetical protein
MPVPTDIAEARLLLERAERESDPEQETRHIEEALLLLESVDDPTPEQTTLVANLRTSYARRLLTQAPKLKSVSFEVWLFYFNVLVSWRRGRSANQRRPRPSPRIDTSLLRCGAARYWRR